MERALVCISFGSKEKSVGDSGRMWGGTFDSIYTPIIALDRINNSTAPTWGSVRCLTFCLDIANYRMQISRSETLRKRQEKWELLRNKIPSREIRRRLLLEKEAVSLEVRRPPVGSALWNYNWFPFAVRVAPAIPSAFPLLKICC